jgi:hypothetical protein
VTALIIALAVGAVIALIGFLTARDDGSAVPPRWPVRYPAGPRRSIFGDVRRRLAAVVIAAAVMSGPVSEAEWDAACRRHWQPGDEETEVRT